MLIAEADVLEVSLGELAAGPYVLVGNVPYYITTPILFHALVPPRAERAVYLVQREVADRLAAAPGTQGVRRADGERRRVRARRDAVPRAAGRILAAAQGGERGGAHHAARRAARRRRDEERPFRLLVQGAFGMRRKQMRRVLRSLCAFERGGRGVSARRSAASTRGAPGDTDTGAVRRVAASHRARACR